jgi:hypothetical protein
MFALGIIFIVLGVLLAAFNERVARKMGGHRYYTEDFLYSVPRQNIAVIGLAFIFGGFLMMYLS